MVPAALESNQITKVGVVVIVALVLVGVVLSFVITAVVGRLIILVGVVVLSLVVWQQRTSLKNKIDDCKLNATFFGVHVSAPSHVVQTCERTHRSS
jgi:protein-S-isoprenylcysteine O-methyltransferase Ste14